MASFGNALGDQMQEDLHEYGPSSGLADAKMSKYVTPDGRLT